MRREPPGAEPLAAMSHGKSTYPRNRKSPIFTGGAGPFAGVARAGWVQWPLPMIQSLLCAGGGIAEQTERVIVTMYGSAIVPQLPVARTTRGRSRPRPRLSPRPRRCPPLG
jgi:hypothetical protein